jgi:SPP1 gp7 family putative phage head morphogenesis protein
MSKIDEFYEEITDFRQSELNKSEKRIFKELEKIYKEGYSEILLAIYALFSKASSGLLKREDIFKHSRDKKFKNAVSDALSKVQKKESALIYDELENQIHEEYAYSLFLFNMLKGKIKKGKLTDKAVKDVLDEVYFGEHFRQTLAKQKLLVEDSLFNSIVIKSAQGLAIREAIKEVKTKLETGIKKAQLTYVTELTRKKSAAGDLAFKKSGLKVKALRFVATMDERTCSQCRSYHNNLYTENNVPQVPVHPKCRCRIIYDLIDDYSEAVARVIDPETGMNYLTDIDMFNKWKESEGL